MRHLLGLDMGGRRVRRGRLPAREGEPKPRMPKAERDAMSEMAEDDPGACIHGVRVPDVCELCEDEEAEDGRDE